MAFATAPAREPLSAINTTPLIDVLLVLLVMIIMTVPISTHTTEIDLPSEKAGAPSLVSNKIVVSAAGQILWNGTPVSSQTLTTLLLKIRQMPVEPELQFEPEANASYELSARVLSMIEAAGVTKLGFVGNEKYRHFGRSG